MEATLLLAARPMRGYSAGRCAVAFLFLTRGTQRTRRGRRRTAIDAGCCDAFCAAIAVTSGTASAARVLSQELRCSPRSRRPPRETPTPHVTQTSTQAHECRSRTATTKNRSAQQPPCPALTCRLLERRTPPAHRLRQRLEHRRLTRHIARRRTRTELLLRADMYGTLRITPRYTP